MATAQPDYSQLLNMMKNPWYASPWAQGGMALLGGIGDVLQGESPEEKYYKWKLSKGKELYGQLGNEMKSPVISPMQRASMMGNYRNSLQPLTNRFAGSPEQTRTLSREMAPLLMEQSGNLDLTNLLETLRRNMAYRGMQGGL